MVQSISCGMGIGCVERLIRGKRKLQDGEAPALLKLPDRCGKSCVCGDCGFAGEQNRSLQSEIPVAQASWLCG